MKQTNGTPRKKKKCYVLTMPECFPQGHPKADLPTNFACMVERGIKIHTVLSGFEQWAKKAEAVNRGEAYISIRAWVGKPCRKGSTQREIKRLDSVCVQKLAPLGGFMADCWAVDYEHVDMSLLASNDGLSVCDLTNCFFSWNEPLEGAVIQFTDFKY